MSVWKQIHVTLVFLCVCVFGGGEGGDYVEGKFMLVSGKKLFFNSKYFLVFVPGEPGR